ncbi:MAG: DNA mismatch repair endonuclease MutL [Bacteroidia bacterium]
MSSIIELLPDAIANQIAAGEVVQRPASVVKETLENALDAGATEIQLSIQEAGKSMIQIIDNGKGMNETDARMCFERHATSKIKKVDDLFNIHTFGFRGEAMASIGAVARVELKTKQAHDELGTEILIEDSRVLSQQPAATKNGTCITVKNLFFNVPARKNFLKSNKVEIRHISDEFVRAALSRPDVAFKFYIDNDLTYDLRSGNFKKRVIQLFGKAYEKAMVEVKEDSAIVKISGYVATPEMAKKTRGDQFFLANGRFIKSPYFNHSVVGAFEKLIPEGYYPAYFLKFELEPSKLDVNVHPTKTEVKFEDDKAIYAILSAAIKKALNDFHVAPVIDFDQDKANLEHWMQGSNSSKNIGFSAHASSKESLTNKVSSIWTPPAYLNQQPAQGASNWKSLYQGLENTGHEKGNHLQNVEREKPSASLKSLVDFEIDKKPFQLANKYLVSTIRSGLLLVHQNRAHERVLYEKFSKSIKEGKSKTQKKLFPEVVQLNANQYKAIMACLNQINDIGFELSSFGNNAILVNGLPEEVSDDSCELVVRKMADEFSKDNTDDTLSLKDSLAKSLAKGAAIKTGKTLSQQEVLAIIEQLFACKEPYYSIDGKQTLQVMSIDELDNKF